MDELYEEVDNLLNAVISQSNTIEKEALKLLNRWLLQFPTRSIDGQQVLFNDETVASLIANARRELERAFAGASFDSMAEELLEDYGKIIDNAVEIHEELNDLGISDTFRSRQLSPAQQLAVRQTSAYLSSASLSAQVVSPLTKVLFEAVQFGYTLSEAQEAIAESMNFGKYVGQIARDGLFQFDGTIHKIIADEYDLDAIEYVGSLVEDSRGQCAKWISESPLLQENLSEEIAWAKRSGDYKGRKKSGMIPETNEQNFFVYRGGYNCRHRAIPTRSK